MGLKKWLIMANLITFHVTARLRDVLRSNSLVARAHLNEGYHPKEPFEIYCRYLGHARKSHLAGNVPLESFADLLFADEEAFQLAKRRTHIYFTDKFPYLIWKFHKRRMQNARRGMSIDDVALLKLTVDESDLRNGRNGHLMVLDRLPDLDKRLLGYGSGYFGFLQTYFSGRELVHAIPDDSSR